MANIMVFAPHPDDDIIGCGGSIVKHVRQGNNVEVVYLTSGESGGLGGSPEEILAIREYEAKKAAKHVGAGKVHFLRQPDGYLAATKENTAVITTLIRQTRPDIIYIPPANDNHHDHRVAHELLLECCQRSGVPRYAESAGELWSVGTILCYEINTPLDEVNYVENITDSLKTKIEALKMHKSQLLQLEYDEAVTCMNRLRGITTGQGTYCECFKIIKAAKLL